MSYYNTFITLNVSFLKENIIMKKIAHFLVKYRLWLLGFMVAFTGVSGFLLTKVNINYDLSKYLPTNSQMRVGLEVMEDEFHDGETSSIKIVIQGLDEPAKNEVYNILLTVGHGTTVDFDVTSPAYNNDDYTLYFVTIPDDAYSPLAKTVYAEVDSKLANYKTFYEGKVVEAQDNYIIKMAIIGVVIIAVVLVILSNSWFEPLIFMATVGIAVIVNMGTNAIFPSVSNITFSIGAVLQLVLSMDYAIMLMDRYRQEKLLSPDNNLQAMKNALSKGAQAILSSSITTIASLLCLVFMSFSFGLDLGLVLAKGILFSLITAFTVLPALILMSDKLIEKTKKKTLTIKFNKVADAGHKMRKVTLGVFLVLFAGSTYMSYQTHFSYHLPPLTKDHALIEKQFPTQNKIVIMYENADEAKVGPFATDVLDLSGSVKLDAYATTIGAELDVNTLSSTLNIDPLIVKGFMHDYRQLPLIDLSLHEYATFIGEELALNPSFAPSFDEASLGQIAMLQTFTDLSVITASYNAAGISAYTQMDETSAKNIIMMYNANNGLPLDSLISLPTFVNYTLELSENPLYAAMFTPQQVGDMTALATIMNVGLAETTFTSDDMSTFMANFSPDFTSSLNNIVYLLYAGTKSYTPALTISLYDFMSYLVSNVATNTDFSTLIDSDALEQIGDNYALLVAAKQALVGPNYSRMIITTSFAKADEQSITYFGQVEQLLKDNDISYYLIGDIPLAYEMKGTFRNDLNLITLLTVLVIFVVVAIAFKSLFIPLLLVVFIQTSIFLTMSLPLITGNNLYFLAIIVVQAILMGAAIDYAILFTSFYRSERKKLNIKDAIKASYKGSLPTILTSSIILISVTIAVGFISSDAVISSVVFTLAQGMTISVLFTLFLLPPIISLFDKYVCFEMFKRKVKKVKEKEE